MKKVNYDILKQRQNFAIDGPGKISGPGQGRYAVDLVEILLTGNCNGTH